MANAEFFFNDAQNEALAEQLREKRRFYREQARDHGQRVQDGKSESAHRAGSSMAVVWINYRWDSRSCVALNRKQRVAVGLCWGPGQATRMRLVSTDDQH